MCRSLQSIRAKSNDPHPKCSGLVATAQYVHCAQDVAGIRFDAVRCTLSKNCGINPQIDPKVSAATYCVAVSHLAALKATIHSQSVPDLCRVSQNIQCV